MRSSDITIVIPTKNRANFLKKCLTSVKDLYSQPARVIVVVDSEKNQQEKKVLSNFQKLNVECVTNSRLSGANGARNTGILMCDTKYLMLLDDDDRVSVDYLCSLEESIRTQEFNAYFGKKKFFYSDELSKIIKTKSYSNEVVDAEKLTNGNYVGTTSGVILPTEAAKSVLFDEELPALQDFDFWLRLAKAGCIFNVKNTGYVKYTIHRTNSQISGDYNRYLVAEQMFKVKYKNDISVSNKIGKTLFYMTQRVCHRRSYLVTCERFIKNPHQFSIKCIKLLLPYSVYQLLGVTTT